jgi:subtilase family serine protease
MGNVRILFVVTVKLILENFAILPANKVFVMLAKNAILLAPVVCLHH